MLDEPIDAAPLAEAFERLRGRFPESVLGASYVRKELVVRVRREDLVPVLRFLKYEEGFNALNDVVGLDNLKPVPPAGPTPAAAAARRFTLLYLLYRFPEACRVRVAVDAGEGETVDSIVDLYPAADWAEREVFDMFGVVFAGHPDLRRVYLPDEFEGHPLRKDFPLQGRSDGV
jgi:NADH-quinone oxidoreductase subunit C